MIHLQRDWCWYVEIDPVGRFSLCYFCWWFRNAAAVGIFWYFQLYCKHGRFSISTGDRQIFVHQWHHWRRGIAPVQPVNRTLQKKKTWKGQPFKKDNFHPKMALGPLRGQWSVHALFLGIVFRINGYNWSIVYPGLLSWKFAFQGPAIWRPAICTINFATSKAWFQRFGGWCGTVPSLKLTFSPREKWIGIWKTAGFLFGFRPIFWGYASFIGCWWTRNTPTNLIGDLFVQ